MPPSRHVQTSFQDLLGNIVDQFESSRGREFKAAADQLDSLALYDFQLVRRRMKHSFQPFSDAGTGHKTHFHGMSEGEIDHEEAAFMDDFFSLLEAAHFRVLSRDDWDAAMINDFTFTNPMEVAWGSMDRKLLQKFWSSKPELYANAAAISDRVLVLNRGIHLAEAKGMFIEDKIDLLVLYLIARPFENLARPFLEKFLKREWRDIWPKIEVEDGKDKGLDRKRFPVEKGGLAQGPQTKDPLLKHANARWVQRVTLKDLMPNAKSVFKLLFKTVNIQEPAFNDTIILYRRDADSKHAEQEDEKKPVKPASYDELKRNIHIKRFVDVPLADLEMIFPDKRVYLKPLLLLQLFVTILIGTISVFVTFLTTEASWSLLGGVASIVGTRAYTVYSSATLGRQKVLDQITDRLYNQTMDAQDGVIYFLLDQMADQHVKEQLLAYFILLLNGEPITQSQLDRTCEDYLKTNFKEAVDFALENSLPLLLEDGLISKDAQGRLKPVPIEEGRKILSRKGQKFFELEDKGEHPQLPVFSKLSNKKIKPSKAGKVEAPAQSDILYESPQADPAAGEKQAVKTSGVDSRPAAEEGPKPSITPPDRIHRTEQQGGAHGGKLLGGVKNLFSGKKHTE